MPFTFDLLRPFFRKPASGGGSGISFVGQVFADGGTNSSWNLDLTSLTGGSNSSPSANDIVVLHIGYTASGTTTAPTLGESSATYTDSGAFPKSNDNIDTWTKIMWKKMGGTPDSSITVTQTAGSGTSPTAGARAMVFRGVDGTTPFDGVTPVEATVANSTNVDPGAIDTATNNAWVVAFATGGDNNATGGSGFSAGPSGYSNFFSDHGASTWGPSLGVATLLKASAGSEDPGAFTGITGTADSAGAVTISLRPT